MATAYLNSLNFAANLAWNLSNPNVGYSPTNQAGSTGINLNGISLVSNPNLNAQTVTLNPSTTQTVSLIALQNLVYQNYAASSVVLFFAQCASVSAAPGGIAQITPAGSNANHLWHTTIVNAGTQLYPGQSILFSDSPTGTGIPVSSTYSTFNISNPGTQAVVLSFQIVGG